MPCLYRQQRRMNRMNRAVWSKGTLYNVIQGGDPHCSAKRYDSLALQVSKILLIKTIQGKPVKKLPEEVLVTSTGSTYELHKEIARKAGISIDRLRITKGSDGRIIPNKHSLTVYDTGLREQSTIYVKDIGRSPCHPERSRFTLSLFLTVNFPPNYRASNSMANNLHPRIPRPHPYPSDSLLSPPRHIRSIRAPNIHLRTRHVSFSKTRVWNRLHTPLLRRNDAPPQRIHQFRSLLDPRRLKSSLLELPPC